VKKIGFLSFGHWTPSPQSQTRSGADALLQSIDLAVAAEELGADVVVLYRTRPLSPEVEGDLAVVASPSAARALADVNPAIPVVTIGPETTAAAAAAGLAVLREAPSADVEGLVRAVSG
jgi:uroporphyrinogen-III synthase